MIDIVRPIAERHEMLTSTQSLFPNWTNAAPVLKAFCDQTDGWLVDNAGCHLTIRPKYPPINEFMFPLEHTPMMDRILDKLGKDYLPDLSKLMGNKISNELKHHILYEIKNKECDIIYRGGRSFKDEMRFRLGVYYV
jgi:hypothetical protein